MTRARLARPSAKDESADGRHETEDEDEARGRKVEDATADSVAETWALGGGAPAIHANADAYERNSSVPLSGKAQLPPAALAQKEQQRDEADG